MTPLGGRVADEDAPLGGRVADEERGGVSRPANREAMLDKLADLDAQHAVAVAGGGEKYVDRHHARGKLTARERIELLVDPGSAFLELSPLAGWGSDFTVGASVVTGIGVVEGVECMISANDPTVKGGASNPWTVRKIFRASQIAEENNLPTISLVESGGADLPTQKEIFIPGGKLFRDLTRASARRQPTIALVFGNSTAGGAYVPGMSDYTVFVRGGAKVFLGGPPLVKMATGEESDDESLGGAEMHARVSGLADYLAEDEHDAIRIGRRIVARLNRPPRWSSSRARNERGVSRPTDDRGLDTRPLVPHGRYSTTEGWAEPDSDPEGLLDLIPTDLKEPFDPREVIVRIVDGVSEHNGRPFDEFKPLYGTSLVTGWAEVHGRPIGILANAQGVLFSEEAQKATQFIQLANSADTPLLFLHNTTGYMVGKDYEQGGIIKHGAMMINAVSNSTVPHLSVIMGASYGAGNYGMNGRAFDPRFLFTWPSAKSAVMGPAQLAGVLSIVARAAAEAKGQAYDEDGDAGMRAMVEQMVEEQSLPYALSGMLYDDGVIDPRDTRTVLAICLSVIENAPIKGADGFGVFRP
jgi:acetyl-CoA carboxylase carboxyltransferase component